MKHEHLTTLLTPKNNPNNESPKKGLHQKRQRRFFQLRKLWRLLFVIVDDRIPFDYWKMVKLLQVYMMFRFGMLQNQVTLNYQFILIFFHILSKPIELSGAIGNTIVKPHSLYGTSTNVTLTLDWNCATVQASLSSIKPEISFLFGIVKISF